MAITLHIYYTGEKGSAATLAREMLACGVVEQIRQEEGNLQYEYFLPVEGGESLLLIDRWENQQALDRHHATPMMQTIAALREKHGLTMRVERYVDDKAGIPEKDRAFIRM